MSTGAPQVQDTKPDAGTETPVPPQAPAVKSAGASPLQEKAPQVTPSPAPQAPKRYTVQGAEDDIPTDAELIELSPKAFKARLDRAGKTALKDRFGTDDPKEVKAKLERLAELEQGEEDRRLAQLTELEREREIRAQAQREAEAWRTRFERQQERQVLEREDQRVNTILTKYMEPKFIKRWIPDLAEHIAECSDEDLNDPEKVIAEWAKTQIEENPEIAKGFKLSSDPKGPPKAKVDNGIKGARPDQPSRGVAIATKTASPGKANSMTKAELEAFKRERGFSW